MRIEKIVLKNYRQFKTIEISLDKKYSNDLHVVIGTNGTGKTNILNAINWCLYGDEPHFSKNSQLLPIVNLKSVENAIDGKMEKITSEIWASTSNGKTLVFRRQGNYNIYEDEHKVIPQSTNFEIEITDEDGDSDFLEEDRAIPFVDRILPKRIREFFFFDGERLDKYFKEATGQNIRHAIFEIAQIDLLDVMERRLKGLSRELEKDAGKQNPEIERVRKELEKYDNFYDEANIEIEGCNKQIKIAKGKIAEYTEKLAGLPNIEELEKRRNNLNIIKKEKKEMRNTKAKEKQELLFESGRNLMLWDCIKQSIQVIAEKKKNKELPPTHDKTLIDNTFKNKICALCGQTIKGDSEKTINDLVNKTNIIPSEIAFQLLDMGSSLNRFEENVKSFHKKIKKVTNEIDSYDKELRQAEQDIDNIDKELSGYDAETIKDWHIERKNYEKTYESNASKLGILQLKKYTAIKHKEKLERQLEEELKRENKLKQLKIYFDFCNKAYEIVKKTKETIMADTREEIRLETKKLFFSLIWKKETFKDITIDDDYNINLIHSMGYECLGSVSAAERELLALSFTLALHKVSGFDSPILIDTPVARVSDLQRENFGKVLVDISNNKQTILLFTPSEYSEDISKLLDKKSTKYLLKMSSDEKETKLEVL